jgi:hypothetical protein
VAEPSRASPEFDAMFSVTEPSPVPLDGAPIAIQPLLLAAVHVHAGELADTVTRIDPPFADTVVRAGEIEN